MTFSFYLKQSYGFANLLELSDNIIGYR